MNLPQGPIYTDMYGRKWQGPYHFNLTSILSDAPKAFGIYQVLKKSVANYEVMYIGIATGQSINDRLKSHCRGLGNKNIAGIGNPTDFWFVYWLCDILSAKQIESHVISNQKPPFNVKSEYKNYISNIYIH